MDVPRTIEGIIMKVGNLVRWQNGYKKYELGVVTEVHPEQAMVWFFLDEDYSIMTLRGLEVIA